MAKGKVKWFDPQKGFGFIEQTGGEDLFVHFSEINMDGYKKLEDGQEVKFESEKTDEGLAAVNVVPLAKGDENGSKPKKKIDKPEKTENLETDVPEVDNFEELGLEERIIEGVDEAGFSSPRPIQIQTIPPLLEDRDLVGTAPTGTGKTAAFLLPIFQKLAGETTGLPRALILAPTHELADQICEEAQLLSQNLDLVVESVYGGTDIFDEIDRLKGQVDVLVACPGRLRDHLSRFTVKLRDVEIFVLDEADRMCDMGFLPEIKKIMHKLPKNRQNLFFSATIPKPIQKLADRILNDPVKVSVGRQAPTKTISHYVIEIPGNKKKKALKKILNNEEVESALVFCRTRNTVRNLAQELREKDYDACGLQGGMDSLAREATLSGFRRQSFRILVATNVAARGLDVEHISHVINYDIPEEPDVYTHRIGRTGRAGVEGEAYTLVTPRDKKYLKAIENTIGYRIDRKNLSI